MLLLNDSFFIALTKVLKSVYVVLPIFISVALQPDISSKVAVTFSTCMHPLPPYKVIVPDEDVQNTIFMLFDPAGALGDVVSFRPP